MSTSLGTVVIPVSSPVSSSVDGVLSPGPLSSDAPAIGIRGAGMILCESSLEVMPTTALSTQISCVYVLKLNSTESRVNQDEMRNGS